MAKARGIRRFLRFSLRSLVLLTLVVATWLGYEVHQARSVERQAEAIRALRGEVEFEPSPRSLLRFFEPSTYGRRATIVSLPGENVRQAISLLAGVPALREVQVAYDGTSDLNPGMSNLCDALPGATVVPMASPVEEVGFGWDLLHERAQISFWDSSRAKRRYERFAEKASQLPTMRPSIVRYLDAHRRGFLREWYLPDDYRILRLHDDLVAEVLVISLHEMAHSYSEVHRAAVLVVGDRCVDARDLTALESHVIIGDIDGDGKVDLALESTASPRAHVDRAHQLSGDDRRWLAVYAIEPSGLRSLLPVDHFRPQDSAVGAHAAIHIDARPK